MKKNNSLILSVMCYIVVFIMIQFGISLVALYLDDSIKHPASASPTALSLSSAVASIVIIGLFLWRKWAPISRHHLQPHLWGVLVWTILAALGAILLSTSGRRIGIPWSHLTVSVGLLQQPFALDSHCCFGSAFWCRAR